MKSLQEIRKAIEGLDPFAADPTTLEVLATNFMDVLLSIEKDNDPDFISRRNITIADLSHTINKEMEWAKDTKNDTKEEKAKWFIKAKDHVLCDIITMTI